MVTASIETTILMQLFMKVELHHSVLTINILSFILLLFSQQQIIKQVPPISSI